MKRLFCLLLVFSMLLGVCACDAAPAEDVTYTITFDTNGGSFVNPIAKKANAELAAPIAPTKDGYVFEGWYRDAACTELFAFGTMPTGSLTLYAKWRYVGSDTPSGSTPSGSTPSGSTPSGGTPSGGREDTEDWSGVDFMGQEVKVCVSAHRSPEGSFPAADIYTKGPDEAGTNEVAKEVISRNTRVAKELNINVIYDTRNLYYDAVIEDVEQIVMSGAKNSPDIYNNDCVSLVYSMISGFLWNVKNPGEGQMSFFDFTSDGWYEEYIKGCTFDQEKLYIFAGDYFIDMVRMAHVIYVNEDLMTANLGKLSFVDSVDDFYDYVAAGCWDIDDLTSMSNAVFAEGPSGMNGVTESTDTTVGFAYDSISNWVFSAASGVTLYYQDESYEPKVLQDITEFKKVADKFQALQKTSGVYFGMETSDTTTCFLQGNFLFAVSMVGELETMAFRDVSFAKGIVPVPKWDDRVQESYHTYVRDQAEVGCILNTARAPSAATALMQLLNEESDKVVYTYYTDALNYEYNDDPNARAMMDLVREATGSPFGDWVGNRCFSLYTGTGYLKGLYITDTNLESTFAQEKGAYNDCMAQMIEHFERFD